MKKIQHASEAVNASVIKPQSVIYAAGNAATPLHLLGQLADDLSIKHVAVVSVLPLGEQLRPLFSKERCETLTHRVIFNSYLSREAVNKGRAKYHPMHLSEIPKYIKRSTGIDVVLLSVAGPDNGGNYSLGTTVEGILSAIYSAKKNNGVVIAEKNNKMPFVLGTTIPGDYIDYMLETDYALPTSPVHEPDERARRIADIIASLYIKDGKGGSPGSTLQYGIGEVPEAVTDAIIARDMKDLAIHTELFAGAMTKLVQKGVVSNRWKPGLNCSISSIFLAEDQAGYDWLHYNSSVQSRPCDFTNSVFEIAKMPNMVAINSAIGIDLQGNVWADSLDSRQIYSGVGGQADFIRGAQYAPDGIAIIALKSTTSKGAHKIVDRCPQGITTTAIPSDNVIIVTEHGAFDPRELSLGEHAVGIAHLAAPEQREKLLKTIRDDPAFHRPRTDEGAKVRGFTPYDEAVAR